MQKASDIIDKLIPSLHEESEGNRSYTYRDTLTERAFLVRRSETRDGYSFYLTEILPTNRIAEFDKKGNCINSAESPIIDGLLSANDPNGFMKAARKLLGDDVVDKQIVFSGGGYGTDSRYQNSLEECAKEIFEALDKNVRHNCRREIGDDERKSREIKDIHDSLAYWKKQKATIEQAEATQSGLFKGCHTMIENRLSDDTKKKILDYINSPSQEKWLGTRSLLITSSGTLWQAWASVFNDAPKSGDIGFPDAETMKIAIPAFISKTKDEIDERLATISEAASLAVVSNTNTPIKPTKLQRKSKLSLVKK